MKKTMLFLFLLCSSWMYGQLSVSVKNGVLITQLDREDPYYTNQVNYFPEIDLSWNVKNFSSTIGVNYTRTGLRTESSEFHYSYISIPMYMTYKFNFSKFYVAPQLGLSTDIYISNNSSFARSYIPSVLSGLSIGYNFSDKISFDLSGRYNYALQSVYEIPPLWDFGPEYIKFHSIGIMLGVNYKF